MAGVDAFTETGEPDDVHERDGHVRHRPQRTRRCFIGGHEDVAHSLPQVGGERTVDQRSRGRCQDARALCVTVRDLVLRVTGPTELVAHDDFDVGRELPHVPAEDEEDLVERFL
jgi:hypothetical protein